MIQELARVGRERLDITPLPFRIDRVESELGFARPGESGNYGKAVPRDVHIDVLEVVLASPSYTDAINCHNENHSF